jgi:DNA-binding transcriptional MocR family regulator
MRLIDSDTAEKKLAELVEIYEKRMPKWSPNDMLTSGRDIALKWGYKADGVEKALETIKDMPTVDAEPVNHGQWVDVEFSEGIFKDNDDSNDIGLSITSAKCSLCQRYSEMLQQYRPKMPAYCSHCGARMDG